MATTVALTLALPVFGDAAQAAPDSGSTATTTTTTTFTVRAGDSLVGIAHRFGVRLSALLKANSMLLTSVIHPGDTLIIPAGATAPTSSPSPARSRSSAPAEQSTSGSPYVVQAGDALAGIAWRNGVTLGALVRANGISVTGVIHPGQSLRLPPATRPLPVTRTGGSTSRRSTPTSSTAAPSAPTSQSGSLQTLLTYVRAQVGAPYRFFSSGPDAFDCSGLVVAGFREIGMPMPHQSRALARVGSAVDWRTESIEAGDLVFTSATNDPTFITHVGIALDSRRWVHAIGKGRTVSITGLPSADKVMAVRRVTLP